MEYKILNEIKEKFYDVYINGNKVQDKFIYIERTSVKKLEIIRVTYKNVDNSEDKITVPIFKNWERLLYENIAIEIIEGRFIEVSSNIIKLLYCRPGCVVHLEVPNYYKYNSITQKRDKFTNKYSFFAYELDDVEFNEDIRGKLQRNVIPYLV